MRPDAARIEALVAELLSELLDPVEAKRLAKTPARVAESLGFLTSGIGSRATAQTLAAAPASHGMVITRDIELYSMCEHHLLPFFGRCHVGYVAGARTAEPGELARVVDGVARRLQLQERITEEVAAALYEALEPKGLGVVIEAHHFCMMMRGVEQQRSSIETSAVLGSFRQDAALRRSFFSLAFAHSAEER